MPRHADEFEEEEEWCDDDGEEVDEDDDSTIPCPHCRRPIYEDAERCPHCERYLSAEDGPPSRKPLWIILGAIAVLAAVYVWITHNQ